MVFYLSGGCMMLYWNTHTHSHDGNWMGQQWKERETHSEWSTAHTLCQHRKSQFLKTQNYHLFRSIFVFLSLYFWFEGEHIHQIFALFSIRFSFFPFHVADDVRCSFSVSVVVLVRVSIILSGASHIRFMHCLFVVLVAKYSFHFLLSSILLSCSLFYSLLPPPLSLSFPFFHSFFLIYRILDFSLHKSWIFWCANVAECF